MLTESHKTAMKNYSVSPKGKKALKKYHKSEKGKVARAKAMRTMLLKRRYNITVDDYDKMKQSQNNLCYICGKSETHNNVNGVVRQLSIDHNHITNKVRKLLCHRCNAMIGNCCEDTSILQKGIEYIKEHSDYGLLGYCTV